MKTKSKISQRVLNLVMIMVTLFGALFTNVLPVHASSLNLDEPTEYYYTSVSSNVGYSATNNIYVLKMDGKKVFCVQSRIQANSDEDYVPES